MIEVRPCGCRTVTDGQRRPVLVGTCPQCLPVGSINWLIENGRQLELLDEVEGMLPMGAGDGNEKYAQDPSETLSEIRSLDPSF